MGAPKLKPIGGLLAAQVSPYGKITSILEELSAYLNKVEGISIEARAHTPAARNEFLALEASEQSALLQNLAQYYEILQEATEQEISLKDNSRVIDLFLRKNKLLASAAVIDALARHQCVEIYRANFVQAFRSVSFFAFCSHTREDLTLRPFWKLFKKSEEVESALGRIAQEIFSGQKQEVKPDIERYAVKEINSHRHLSTATQSRLVASLRDRDDGEARGLIHVFDVMAQFELRGAENN